MRYRQGNLLDSQAEALVNTVNTVGVMGKGIALMFKERFPGNFAEYASACKAGGLQIGKVLPTRNSEMYGPKWIVNFPTKKHWRHPSKLEWIRDGLRDLRKFIEQNGVRSIAIPPLGAGNGGLEWKDVRELIEDELGTLGNVDIEVFEPTPKYQNVAKAKGIQQLTPARAIVADLVRRYATIGLECSLVEVQKLAWFAQRVATRLALPNPLKLDFKANIYGPYSDQLRHMLDGLDGSYLLADKRINDMKPFEALRFDDRKREYVETYLNTTEAKTFKPVLEVTAQLIDGFESPLGLELLATIDWLLEVERVEPSVAAIQNGLRTWAGGSGAARRKLEVFEPRLIALALERLRTGLPEAAV